jgi:hypothetical protein
VLKNFIRIQLLAAIPEPSIGVMIGITVLGLFGDLSCKTSSSSDNMTDVAPLA